MFTAELYVHWNVIVVCVVIIPIRRALHVREIAYHLRYMVDQQVESK